MSGDTLYLIEANIMEVMDALDGPLELVQRESLEAQLADMVRARGDKLDRIGAVMLRLELQAEACETEAERVRARARARRNQAERLRALVREVMLAAGERKLEATTVSFRLQDGRESVRVDEPGLIPPELMRPPAPPEPDKALIARVLKGGTEVPGASLVRGEPSLIVRR